MKTDGLIEDGAELCIGVKASRTWRGEECLFKKILRLEQHNSLLVLKGNCHKSNSSWELLSTNININLVPASKLQEIKNNKLHQKLRNFLCKCNTKQ